MSSEPRQGAAAWVASAPLHPLLIAAYPILFLFGQNLGTVTLSELVLPLGLAVGAAGLGLAASTIVLRDARRAAVIVTAVAIATLAYGHGLRIAKSVHLGGVVFLALWGGFVLAAIAFAFLGRRWLASVTRALNAIAALLIILQLVAIVPFEVRAWTTASLAPGPVGLAAASGHTTRDIYYIVLDRYGSARSLELNYGMVENGFYDWLSSHGFVVAPDSHANYGRTGLSVASTLNMTLLDEVARRQGIDSADQGPIDAMLQDHAVGRFLKSAGYRYIHVGSYFRPTTISAIADVNKHLGGPGDFGAAVYDETVLPTIARRLGLEHATPSRQRHADNARYQFQILDGLRSEPGPKFVLAHFLLPHPPYVFSPDGTFLSEEEEAGLPSKDQFRDQVLYTNRAMEAFLEPLVALPEAERPIIIIQADEGPYPPPYSRDTIHYDWSTATLDQLEVKFGILNAMLLPGVDPEVVYPTISSVNTFRLLFDQYFGADLPLLPDRIYTSAGKLRPYDLTDVTDRLTSLR